MGFFDKISLLAGTNLIGKVGIDQTTANANEVVVKSAIHKGEDVILHDQVITTGNGTPFTVSTYKTLTIEIYGTSSSRTITFYGKSKSGTLRLLTGINMSTFTTATNTTGTGEIWQFNITGLDYVIIDVTAVAGGNVSVKGKAVA